MYTRCLWCNGYHRRKWTLMTRVQILDKADCISHSTNTLKRGMNPIILPPSIGRLGSSALVRQPVKEKEKI